MEITSYGKAKQKCWSKMEQTLGFVAPSILDDALCLIAVEHSNDGIIKNSKKFAHGCGFVLAAMKNGNYLGDVPFLNRTEDICREGVKKSKVRLVWFVCQRNL